MSDQSPSRWRVGLVGTGQIAPYHVQALKRMETLEVAGVHDADMARARAFAQRYPVGRAYASLESLLADVDAVHILTPPATHADLAERALAAGCHVFVEKPLATTVAECDRLADAADRAGRRVGVDHSLLLDPFTVRARRLVEQGAIGRVVSVQCLRSQDYPEYEGGELPPHARDAAFPFADLGIHALYQIEAFLGPVERMQWAMRHQGSDYQLAFDEWQCLVECRDGNAQLSLSWTARPLQDVVIVQGTAGVLRIDRFGMRVTRLRQGRLPEHPRRLFNAMAEAAQTAWQVPLNAARVVTHRLRRYHGLQETVREFHEAVRAGRAPLAGPAESRRIVAWMERIGDDARRRWDDATRAVTRDADATTLVTGATGLIGRHLVERLLAESRAVRILCRRLPPEPWRSHPRVEVVLGDLGDPQAVDRAVAGMQVVYHAGGVVQGSRAQFYRGNVRGTANVVASCLKHQVKQLVYVSSLSVLQVAGETASPIAESAELEQQAWKRGLYTQTKLEAEQLVAAAARDRGLPVVIVRPAEVIGPGAPLLSPGVAQRRAGRLVVLGDGSLNPPLVHVEDLVDALRACEEEHITDGSCIHLVDDAPVSQNEIIERWKQCSGSHAAVVHVPLRWLYAAGRASDWLLGCLGRSSPLSVYRLKSALTPRRFDTTFASQRLQWTPRRGVVRGLRETVAFHLPASDSASEDASESHAESCAASCYASPASRVNR
jgi:predicted dehydrogenase/nucleoside-diphosphate-sugar epimerase